MTRTRRKPITNKAVLRLLHLEARDVPAFGNPTWLAQGPSVNGDATAQAVRSGGMASMAADPTNANVVFIGAANGGLWRTTNATSASPTWLNLTDNQLSAAISSLTYGLTPAGAIDPNTLYAGTGVTAGSDQGFPEGVYKITNALSANPVVTLTGQAVLSGIHVRGSIVPIAVGGAEGALATTDKSLYRTVDGGTTWTQVAIANVPLTTQARDVVRDPSQPGRYFVAMANNGVFVSTDNGATWTATANNQLVGIATTKIVRLTIANDGILYVALAPQNGTEFEVSALYRSANHGATWTAVPPPSDAQGFLPGGGNGNFTTFEFGVDPTNSNFLYAANNRVFRGDFTNPTAPVWVNITGPEGAYVQNAKDVIPGPDGRNRGFDAAGNIYSLDDSGVSRLAAPRTAGTNAKWSALNANLTNNSDFYDNTVAYDNVGHVVWGGLQDRGSNRIDSRTRQSALDLSGGDGDYVQVDTTTRPGFTIGYVAAQNLGGFSRVTVDYTGRVVDREDVKLEFNGKRLTDEKDWQFLQPFYLNAIDQRRMVIPNGQVFESLDKGDTLTSVGGPVNAISAAYGGMLNGQPNANVLYVGTGGANKLLLRTTANGPLTPLTAYRGDSPRTIVLDPDNWRTAYVLDFANEVWRTTDAGQTFTNVTGNLDTLTPRVDALTIYAKSNGPGDEVLFVGGRGAVFGLENPTAANPSWVKFGSAIPTSNRVNNLVYDALDNVLIAATDGRGAFSVYNLSNFTGHTAPDLRLNGAAGTDFTTTFTVGGGAIAATSQQLTIGGTASTTLVSATVHLINLQDGNAESLSITDVGAIRSRYDAATGILTLTGVDTVAHYQQMLHTLKYNNTLAAANPTVRTVLFRVDDGSAISDQRTTTINYAPPVVGPPMIALGGPGVANFNAQFRGGGNGGTAVSIVSPNLTITAPGSTNLTRATIVITNLRDAPKEFLAATPSGAIQAANIGYNPTTGTLTINATAPVADYQAVLRSVTYNNTDRTLDPESRLVDFRTDAGAVQGNSVTSTVSVIVLNNAPVLDTTQVFTLFTIQSNTTNNPGDRVIEDIIDGAAPPDRITDLDANARRGIAVVGVDNTNGRWQFTTDGGQTWADFGTPTSAQARQLDADERTKIRFVPNAAFAGTATFTFRAWDQSGPIPLVPIVEANGRIVDTTTNGGTSPYSTAIGTAQITVQAAPLPAPSVEFEDVATTVSEGNGGQIVIKLSAPHNQDVVINYTIAGTATNGTDYDIGPLSPITIPAGETEFVIDVDALDDLIVEPDETIVLTLTSASAGVTLGTNRVHTFTIQDVPPVVPPVATFTVTTQTEPEDNIQDLVFTVQLDKPAPQDIFVQIDFSGTATLNDPALLPPGFDYTVKDFVVGPFTVSIMQGQTTGTFTINLNHDAIVEPTETAVFTIDPASAGITVGAAGTLTLSILDVPPALPTVDLVAVGAGPGGGPHVKVYNPDGTLRLNFFAYEKTFTGGINVATADVTGDGVDDIIVGSGNGGGPLVNVFDGNTGILLKSLIAYNPAFRGGVNVAAGDINGDGIADIITGAGVGGGPHVKVFDGTTLGLLTEFFAYNMDFRGGVNVAAGDVNADGMADIVLGPGVGGGPLVKVYDVANGALLFNFSAYNPDLRTGVTVAAGDVDGDGRADIITGTGNGGGPHVKVFDGLRGGLLQELFAYDTAFRGGVNVAAADLDGDGLADVVTAAGPTGGPHVRGFRGTDLAPLRSFFAYDPTFLGGVLVG